MKNVKTNEVNLIRSRALTVLFSLVLSALILFPVLSQAKGKKDAENSELVYIHALQQNALAAVTIVNVGEGKYNLSLESRDGRDVYYNEFFKSPENFSKVFDFSTLADGEYTFKVEVDGEIKQRLFVIEEGKIKVKYSKELNPSIVTRDSKAIIEFAEALTKSVNISVYSVDGEELVSKLVPKEAVRKQFDFSQVGAGEYKIVVYSENKQYAFNYVKE